MANKTQSHRKTASAERVAPHGPKPRCDLCGKTTRLTKAECCDQWICDDEDKYVLFSYAHTSCSRNHRRYTLCGHHSAEGHPGTWQECPTCRTDIDTEIYVYFGTNEYNFEKLANPPSYEPTKCSVCGKVIVLSEEGYSISRDAYRCELCMAAEFYKKAGANRG
jgi:hypothetical protein